MGFDYILSQGDQVFKRLGLVRRLELDELPSEVNMHGQEMEVIRLKTEHGILSRRENVAFFAESIKNSKDIGNGALFLTNGYTCAIIWSKQYYFIFDPHSHDQNGHISDGGYSALLKFRSATALQHYIRQTYLFNMDEAQYDLHYIKVEVSAHASETISKTVLRLRDKERRSLKRKQTTLVNYEKAAEAKRQRDRECYRKKIGTERHEKIKKQIILMVLKNMIKKKSASINVLKFDTVKI